ncbi:IclR family transcriptional regulator [Haloplanus pelagicus]|jgi:DNA-binding IclR family transcriptional regulator|uniref:IclR family transcriptional regulator n=1 Tax=Haloplanus pelagicus TaxID=2949995 RepID=UPI00203DEF51|nr:IclR family transcriptional regulator [Haloplanus sp. HW8-1]
MTADGNVLQTTTRSLEILEVINAHDSVRADTLVDALGISRSAVHNHLTTLREHEYVVKKGDRYYLGLKLYHLGEQAKTRRLSYEVIGDNVARIANEIDMEVDFSVEEYGRVVVIFDEVGHRNRSGFQLGRYVPIHACASGKAILAAYPAERVASVLDRRGLPPVTDNTIVDREALLDDVQASRERGYAINDEESNSGIKSVGTAIREPDGTVAGGLSIAGPTYNYPPYDQIAETLLSAADEIEREIETRWQRAFQQPDRGDDGS